MQRQIKFRGKRIGNGGWAYGAYIPFGLDTDEPCIFWATETNTRHVTVVIPETVGQYTGIKDKNGKEIYEGDIIIGEIDAFIGETPSPLSVIFADGSFWAVNSKEHFSQPLCYVVECEIKGNVHENPELLEANNE